MKIGIDISQIVFEGTGVASYTRNLVSNLLKLDQNNNYLLFGTSLRQKEVLEEFAKGKYFSIPPTALDFLWNKLHLLPVENLVGKIDVFHSSDWTQPPTKARKVTTIHDLVINKYPEFSHPRIIATQKRRLEWVKKECDLIIADSHSTKNDIVEILGIPENKIRVIYLAAGEEFKTKPINEVKELKLKYRLSEKYILAVGTREPRKNLDRVIVAFGQLNLPDVDLVIAGKYGWGENEGTVKHHSNIKVLGYVSQEELPILYSGAQFFVYPSIYEGFGVPVLEAMKCSCPVLTSNISSLPEVGGEAAIYVNPNDTDDIKSKMNAITNFTKKDREAIIKKSQEQAAKFSWEKTAKETIKVYEELCR